MKKPNTVIFIRREEPMKKIWKRVLSLVLAVAMVAGIVTIDGSKEKPEAAD